MYTEIMINRSRLQPSNLIMTPTLWDRYHFTTEEANVRV